MDLLIGDLRRLPFADGTFTKAFSLDVLEHLSPEALRGMLGEASRGARARRRALRLHARAEERAGSRWGCAGSTRSRRQLDRVGLVDLRQEHLRKSDHLNPLADIPELEQVARDAGFRIARIRYYTPIVGGFVENILVRWPSAPWRGAPRGRRAVVRERRREAGRGGSARAGRGEGAPEDEAARCISRRQRAHRPDDARRPPLRRRALRPVLRGPRAPGRTAPVMTRAARIVAAAPGRRAASERAREGSGALMRVLYCAIDQRVPGTLGGSVHTRSVADGLAASGTRCTCSRPAATARFRPDRRSGRRWRRRSIALSSDG